MAPIWTPPKLEFGFAPAEAAKPKLTGANENAAVAAAVVPINFLREMLPFELILFSIFTGLLDFKMI
jgi:hypothetical protein